MIDGPRPATAWGWANRFARFFALAGVSCFALAVFFNVCFVLPMRRQLELEADFCGLKYAAKACFQLHSVCAKLGFGCFLEILGGLAEPVWEHDRQSRAIDAFDRTVYAL